MLDRSAKTLIAIFTLVAGLLLAMNLAVDQAPLKEWVLAAALIGVSIGFWVWLWQEEAAASSEIVMSDRAAPPAVAQEWIISKDPVTPPHAVIPPAKEASPKEKIPTELISEAKLEPTPPPQAEIKAEVAPEEKAIVEAPPHELAEPAPTAVIPVEKHTEIVAKEEPPAARLDTKVEIPPKEKTQVEPIAKAAPVDSEADEPDDLERVEGIGPKYRDALLAEGVIKFDQVAAMSVEEFEGIAKKAGMRRSASMETWAQQAALAANGDWDALNALQSSLKGGRQA